MANQENTLREMVAKLERELQLIDERLARLEKIELALFTAKKTEELQIALNMRTRERDEAIHEAGRRDKKWMDGIDEIVGRKLNYTDPDSIGMAQSALAELAAQAALVQKLTEQVAAIYKPFPIQNGPSVPWYVMLPHDKQCRDNHGGQDLVKIASRGGLCSIEAWCVVNDLKWNHAWKEPDYMMMRAQWRSFADEQNRIATGRATPNAVGK